MEYLTVRDVLSTLQANKWREAMTEEIRNMEHFDTWTLVKRTKDMNVVGCKWVFTEKTDLNGEVTKYKARLVAQGFKQIAGVDFEETYSPVMRRRCLRILIAIAMERNWEVHQVDVIAAYLNSPLDVVVYMEQPPEFEDQRKNRREYVCQLKQSIYGLKQSEETGIIICTNVL